MEPDAYCKTSCVSKMSLATELQLVTLHLLDLPRPIPRMTPTPTPPHSLPQVPFTANRARGTSPPQSQLHSTFTAPTTTTSPSPTVDTDMKIAGISPMYSFFPSYVRRRSWTSTASMSTGSSTQSTYPAPQGRLRRYRAESW
jgi:hypothetical protein